MIKYFILFQLTRQMRKQCWVHKKYFRIYENENFTANINTNMYSFRAVNKESYIYTWAFYVLIFLSTEYEINVSIPKGVKHYMSSKSKITMTQTYYSAVNYAENSFVPFNRTHYEVSSTFYIVCGTYIKYLRKGFLYLSHNAYTYHFNINFHQLKLQLTVLSK